MSDLATEQAVNNDDWAAALNEQNAAAAAAGAADADSAFAHAQEARTANPAVFEQLNPSASRAGMRNDIGYARSLKGGESALQSALAVNSKDAARINSAADFVKKQAYDLQKITWGKSRLPDAKGTATKLKANAKTVKPVTDAAQKLFAGPDLNLVLASAQGAGQNASVFVDGHEVLGSP